MPQKVYTSQELDLLEKETPVRTFSGEELDLLETEERAKKKKGLSFKISGGSGPLFSRTGEPQPYGIGGKLEGEISGSMIRQILQGIGSGLGFAAGAPSAVGAPAGSTAGFTLGTEASEGLKYALPKIFGEPEGGPSIEELGVNTLFDIVPGGKLARYGIRKALINRFAKKLPQNVLDSLESLIKEKVTRPQFTVGTPGGIFEHAEDILAPEAKKESVEKSLSQIRQGVKETTGLDIERQFPIQETTIAKKAIIRAKSKYVQEKAIEDAAWDDLRDSLPHQKIQQIVEPGRPAVGFAGKAIPPKIKESIGTFIETPNAKEAALKHKETIDKLFGNQPGDTATNRLKREYGELSNTINTIIQETPLLENGIAVSKNLINFESARKIVSSINKQNAGILRKTEANAAVQDLANALNKDISEQLPANVLSKFETAKAASRTLFAKFPEDIRTAITGKPSEFFDIVLQDPETLTTFVKSVGKPRAKEELLTRLLNESISEKTPGAFDTGKILNHLQGLGSQRSRDISSALNTVLTKKEKDNITNIFTVANSISPELSMTGRVAVGIREAGMAINVSSGLFQSLFRGKISSALSTGAIGLSMIFTGRDFTKKVLLNPQVAESTIRGLKSPVGSKEALDSTRHLLKVMKGSEVLLLGRMKTGEEKPLGKFKIPEE